MLPEEELRCIRDRVRAREGNEPTAAEKARVEELIPIVLGRAADFTQQGDDLRNLAEGKLTAAEEAAVKDMERAAAAVEKENAPKRRVPRTPEPPVDDDEADDEEDES